MADIIQFNGLDFCFINMRDYIDQPLQFQGLKG